MAFEAFLTQDKAKPTAKRSLLISASLIAHGALLTAGVIYSFWHVDELSPPTVTVTFLQNAPPPPPPPAAKKKRSDSKRVTREVTQPKPNEITQPVKEEKKEDDDDGVEGGVEGGVAGGVVGGVGTGAPPPANEPPPPPPPPAQPKNVPPAVGMKQLAINPRVAPYNLVMPPNYPSGMRLWALTRICVNPSGNVMGVSLVKGMDPKLDGQLLSRIRSWKFNPYVTEGRAIPFCFTLRYEKVTA